MIVLTMVIYNQTTNNKLTPIMYNEQTFPLKAH